MHLLFLGCSTTSPMRECRESASCWSVCWQLEMTMLNVRLSQRHLGLLHLNLSRCLIEKRARRGGRFEAQSRGVLHQSVPSASSASSRVTFDTRFSQLSREQKLCTPGNTKPTSQTGNRVIMEYHHDQRMILFDASEAQQAVCGW